jgi:hypothetical protein
MCAVIGYARREIGEYDRELIDERRDMMLALARESRVRGLHSVGVAQGSGVIVTEGGPFPGFDPQFDAIVHCRYPTSGDYNQPIVRDGLSFCFNGVLDMGTKEEMEARHDLKLTTDNDAEIFMCRLLRGERPAKILDSLGGSFAGVWLQGGSLYALRNARRPLWTQQHLNAVWIASTKDIFERAGFDEHSVELEPGVLHSW